MNSVLGCYYILADACRNAGVTTGDSRLDSVLSRAHVSDVDFIQNRSYDENVNELKRLVDAIERATTYRYCRWCCNQVRFNIGYN